MHMWRIDHARAHGHTADLKAMLLAQAHRLIRILRNARANQRVILLRPAARDAVIDEGIGTVFQTGSGNEARLQLFRCKSRGHDYS